MDLGLKSPAYCTLNELTIAKVDKVRMLYQLQVTRLVCVHADDFSGPLQAPAWC